MDDNKASQNNSNPTTKPPNIIYNSKFWPNVKPFLEGGLSGVILSTPFIIFHPTIPMALESLAKITRKSLLGFDFHHEKLEFIDIKILEFFFPGRRVNDMKQDMLAKIDKFVQNLKYQKTVRAKQMPSVLVMRTLSSGMLFGTFGFLTKKVEAANEGMPPTLYQNFGCGLFSGAVEACVYTPFSMSLIHLFQSANLTRVSVIEDLYGKARNGGILSLWKGGGFVMIGFCISNVSMLATYNPSYDYLRGSIGLTAHSSVLGAGLISGVFASACSCPYLFVHRTMINMKPNISGKYQFTGYLNCVLKILKFGGPQSFYRGSAPHILLTTTRIAMLWYCLEIAKKTVKSYGW